MPPFRTDRQDRPGGGVVIYARDTCFCKRRSDLEIHGLEAVWLEIVINSKKVLVGGFYRPPNSNTEYYDLITESVDRAFNTAIHDIIITGDFNCNMLSNTNNKIRELLQQYNLKQLINDSTHFTDTSSSLIDLILVNNPSNIISSGVADPFIPDLTRYHCPVFAFLKFMRPPVKSFKRKIWNYARADYEKYREKLQEQTLENLVSGNDIDSNVQLITKAIFDAAEKSIPNKIVTIRSNDHPWITCQIKNLMRKRRRSYRKFKRTANPIHWSKFKTIRNIVVKEIRKSKQAYFDKLESVISSENSNTKLFWKTSKQLLNLNKTYVIPTLSFNNEYAETEIQKANMLNAYFASQSTVNDYNKTLPQQRLVSHGQFDTFVITPENVKDVFDNLDISKSCGPDMMSPRLLKEASSILAKPYSKIFNQSLHLGKFPSSWKDANVTAIHKKDDRSTPSNYRPISLLCQSGKSMERCIHKMMFNYIQEHKILTPFQSGFTPGDSTTFQLIHTYHTFCEAVDRGKEVRVVFCDISKAFDRVWHRGLLHKLAGIGCTKGILKWFSSYLSDRRQRVLLHGQASEWAFVKAGVPQGSILGPLLFLIYINDIVNELQASVRLFADDTSLYLIIDNPNTAAIVLNNDLRHISSWADDWLVNFNPSKTCTMLISRKQEPIDHPPLFMSNILIGNTNNHKHLGLTFSNNCNWTEHISNITTAAWTRLNLLRVLKFKLTRHALEKLYISFIRPLLEYSDAVWDNATTENKKQLEAVHNEAARIITGATKLCSIDNLLADLGWDSLQKRRHKHKLMIFYKIMNGLTPDYLQNIVPPLVQETVSYNLRNSGDLRNIRTHTNLFYHSFLPSAIRAWNELPDDVKSSPTVQSFKYKLNRDIHSPPKYFNAGSRIGQILHARLRMECSSLNSHLYRKNIVDSPSCSCGEFESAYHFFFQCKKYSVARHTYLSDLNNLTTHQLLYGSMDASDNENEILFLKVQEFIINSGRFI